MKKKKVLIILSLFFMFICNVSAKEELKPAWKNDDISMEYTETLTEVSEGYLMGGYDEDFLAHIAKFDKNGKEVKNLTLEKDFTIVGINEKNGSYYVVALDDNWYITVYKLSTNLEIEDSIKTTYYLYDWNDVVYFGDESITITSLGWYKFEGVADSLDKQYLLLSVDYDLKNYKAIEFKEDWNDNLDLLNDYYPEEYEYLFMEQYFGTWIPIPIDFVKTQDSVVVVYKRSATDLTGTVISFFDWDNGNNYNSVEKENIAWWYVDVALFDNYVYAVGTNYNNIDIYDLNGNLIDSFDVKDLYSDKEDDDISISVDNIISDEDGIVVSYTVCDVVDNCSVNCKNGILRYSKPYNVVAKTDGNGTVKVSSDTNYTGSDVTFTIEPREGYVLDKVKVTDSDGNVVVFKDNTFTMPSSDVTIEVTFVKKDVTKNPDTSDIAIIGSIIIIVAGVVLTLVNLRKIKELE